MCGVKGRGKAINKISLTLPVARYIAEIPHLFYFHNLIGKRVTGERNWSPHDRNIMVI